MVWMSEKKLGKRATKSLLWDGPAPFFEVICSNSFDTNPLYFFGGNFDVCFWFWWKEGGLKGKTVGKNHCFCGSMSPSPPL